jgi:hypothetical protein
MPGGGRRRAQPRAVPACDQRPGRARGPTCASSRASSSPPRRSTSAASGQSTTTPNPARQAHRPTGRARDQAGGSRPVAAQPTPTCAALRRARLRMARARRDASSTKLETPPAFTAAAPNRAAGGGKLLPVARRPARALALLQAESGWGMPRSTAHLTASATSGQELERQSEADARPNPAPRPQLDALAEQVQRIVMEARSEETAEHPNFFPRSGRGSPNDPNQDSRPSSKRNGRSTLPRSWCCDPRPQSPSGKPRTAARGAAVGSCTTAEPTARISRASGNSAQEQGGRLRRRCRAAKVLPDHLLAAPERLEEVLELFRRHSVAVRR